MNSEIHSPLGKPTQYQDRYDPSLLFTIARAEKRNEMGIGKMLPFFGMDIWNAYELSWLNARGKPQIALAEFYIPADSPNLVESKSLKLYLNSFNQTRLTDKAELYTRLSRDLSDACGAPVQVRLIEPDHFGQVRIAQLSGYCIDNLNIEVDTYLPCPELLHAHTEHSQVEETLVSHLLKSNCLVTGQPDWGSVSIQYVGAPINREGLLKYLISFRQHNEFHEQCVERIFMDIMRQCAPLKLAVYARYTRRGGLDINPYRTNFSGRAPENVRTARQ